MRRRVVMLSVAMLLSSAVHSTYSSVLYDIVDNYYTDSTFASACGWTENYCGGPNNGGGTDSYGCITNYRDHILESCQTGEITHSCQVWNGTQWTDIDCSQTYWSEGGRLRVPIG